MESENTYTEIDEEQVMQMLFDYQEHLSSPIYYRAWMLGMRKYFEEGCTLFIKRKEGEQYLLFKKLSSPSMIEEFVNQSLELFSKVKEGDKESTHSMKITTNCSGTTTLEETTVEARSEVESEMNLPD